LVNEKRYKMRLFLHFIFVFLAITSFVACNVDEPQNVTSQPDDTTEGLFKFSDERASQRALSLNIECQDPEMEYVVFLAQKKYFILNDIDSDKKLFDDDLSYVQDLAKQYNMPIRDFLSQMKWLVKGAMDGYTATSLYPDTEYIVYCYGVEFTDDGFEATSEVEYTIIKTAGPIVQDVTFDIDCTVNGNLVDIDINPNGYEGYYYYYVVPETWREYVAEGEAIDSTYIEMYSNITFDNFNKWLNVDAKAVEEFCSKGRIVFEERVEPNANYMVVAFAVSEDTTPLLSSTPSVKYFTSKDFVKSSLKLDIDVTGITPYEAHLNVRPSNNNETYTCIFLAASQVPLVDNDYQLMKALADGFAPSEFTGPIKNEYLGPLMPNTEYVVFAFGIDGNMPTTDLYQVRFTSEESVAGTTQITDIKLLKLFDADEIIALDSSYRKKLGECECVAIVEATTNEPCDKLYFWWYEEWMKVGYTQEAFLEDLLMYDPANNPEIMDMYYSEDSEDIFFFAGIAADKDDNLGDIYYGDGFLLSKDMVSPAEEFFQYVESPSASTFMLTR